MCEQIDCRSDGQQAVEDHAHNMGHHAIGHLPMEGQALHGQVLVAYPTMSPEVSAAAGGEPLHRSLFGFVACRAL